MAIVHMEGWSDEGKWQLQGCECKALWLALLGVINTLLAPLVNCQRDLTEDGKVVREAFQAEMAPACEGCCRVQGGVSSQPGLEARESLETVLLSLSPASS